MLPGQAVEVEEDQLQGNIRAQQALLHMTRIASANWKSLGVRGLSQGASL